MKISTILKQVFILSSLVILLILPFFVFAGSPLESLQNVAEGGGYAENVSEYSFSQFLGDAIQAFLSLLGVLFITLMMYGGFKWMKASGREEDVKIAQDTIRRAIIGLVIIVASWAITSFVLANLIY